ncbi:MAG: ASKHA domain-containing protein [Chloroflexota bacterium]
MPDRTPEQPSTHRLILMPSGRQGDVPHGTTVLDAARSLGVEIESICGGRQTCGKCQVAPEWGTFHKHGITSAPDHLTPPGEVEREYAEGHGIDLGERRLSCAACVEGDLLIHVPEESQARKQVVRKEASALTIEVAPALRLVYVEVEPAVMGGPADWQRLQAALAEQWELPDLAIDPLLLRTLQKTLRAGKWAATVTVWQEREVIRIEPGYVESLYGLAVDVGSTTVAGHLCDLLTGAVLATESMMNPQVRYGEDLMSRVSYGMTEPQGVQRLHRAIIRALNELAQRAAERAGIAPGEIGDVVLVGNTVMHHLLLGIDPVELGGSPFALATQDALDLKARDLGLDQVHPAAMVHILPCIAGHVGADNVGVLLAEQPSLDDQISLVVDIGTNAEILLGNRERMLSASSPTGPAFEGAQISHGQRAAPGAVERVRIDMEAGRVRFRVIGDERWSDEFNEGESPGATGICGSGIIEVVGELFVHGLIDRGGRFAADADRRHPCVRYTGRTAELVLATAEQTASGREIVVTQNDIRQIQLAKAALYAGARLLMDHLGVERVDRIKLAGAFGSYIDPRYAMIIGLIPDCDLARVEVIGNAAGDGARIALVNAAQREVARRAARAVEYVETAVEPHFQDYFVAAMGLPHGSEPFPHLAGIIPEASGEERPARRRSRQSSGSR